VSFVNCRGSSMANRAVLGLNLWLGLSYQKSVGLEIAVFIDIDNAWLNEGIERAGKGCIRTLKTWRFLKPVFLNLNSAFLGSKSDMSIILEPSFR